MKRKTTKEFIDESIAIHDNRYDYSLVKYKNNKTKVEIICQLHGKFLQVAKSHLMGSGCIKCHHTETSKRLQYNNADFIKLAKEKHNNKYDYSTTIYVNSHSKVNIVCQEHGTFMMLPSNHIYGQGCPKCGQMITGKYTTAQFIQKAKLCYNGKFDYSLVEYKNSTTPVIIKCPEHGKFKQRPDYHLTNTISCPTCVNNIRSENGIGGYSMALFEANSDLKTKAALLYVVKIYDNNESFIKVGITIQSLSARFSKFNINGYKIVPIYTSAYSLYDAFIKEQSIIQHFIGSTYKPKRKFNGWTECFVSNITQNIINFVDQQCAEVVHYP